MRRNEAASNSRLSPLEQKISRGVGSFLGELSVRGSIFIGRLQGEIFNPNSFAFRLNPFLATTDQIKERHAATWTGETADERLARIGVEKSRIALANSYLQSQKRPTLDSLYYVGEAKSLYEGKTEGVYVEVDGKENTPAKYYIGLIAVLKDRSLTWEGLRASLN